MSCACQHIPARLHTDDRPLLNTFAVGEEIYRRCKEEELENPFAKISIADVSVNRQGLPENQLSQPNDVLINTTECGAEDYDLEVCILKIKDLKEDLTFDKVFEQDKDDVKHTARMKLVHDPEDCMYPHCEFRVWLNNERLTLSNFSTTMNKLKIIKASLKHELATMIVQREISQSSSSF